ncbi:MAG: hypothetical protein KBS85_08645, partial [Lachnospiraceae bacterium]|nr:hypothetical protein [Candidatus Merdinaster equi]
MNITILTLSLTMGGAERVICNMCNDYLIKNEENNVTIISLMKAEPEYELDDRVRVRFIDDTKE